MMSTLIRRFASVGLSTFLLVQTMPISLNTGVRPLGMFRICFLLGWILFFPTLAIVAQDDYPLGADSQLTLGVPQGKVTQYILKSRVFPNTIRRYWIYVPAQYDPDRAASLMVFQDGHAYVDRKGSFRVPVVFDNLIHQKKLPVIIGVFVDPGHKKKDLPEKPGWKPTPENRSFEYDSLTPQYSKMLLEEVLPRVKEKYNLTDDPQQRGICGISSGGICAFTVAWERPDVFSKVLSHVGSFVNIRGGHHYAAMIRKTEPKPIRVFIQGGAQDLDNEHGNWPLANQQLAKSLAYQGYDHKFVFGTGGHNGKHGGATLPESLVWLWRKK